MEKRTTIYDIAKKLNISTATVNRALTGKPRVKEETRALVIKTATEMGFKPNALAQSLARRRMRLVAVAFTSFPEFHGRFLRGVEDAAAELKDFNIDVDYFRYDDGATNTAQADAFFEDALEQILAGGYDGVLLLARESDRIELLREKGVYIATAVNDVSPELRRFCIRYNGFVAGRMAAELIYRLMPDRERPVCITTGGTDRAIHRQILDGFRSQMEYMPLNLCAVSEQLDNEQIAYEETNRLLDKHPDVGAIYVTSFNSRSVIRAVEEHGLSGKVLMITSDIYDELRGYIRSGTVTASIFQNQYEQGRQGLHALYQALIGEEPGQDTIMIDPRIIMASNLELF